MTTRAPAQANATTTNLRTIGFIVRSDNDVNTAREKSEFRQIKTIWEKTNGRQL